MSGAAPITFATVTEARRTLREGAAIAYEMGELWAAGDRRTLLLALRESGSSAETF